ncbi:MAG: hypothetical protein AB7V42_02385 [Thermoleophilia bacterium]
MKRTSALVAGLMVATALSVGATSAVAAPAKAAPAKAKAVKKAKANQTKTFTKISKAYNGLLPKVTCPAGATKVAQAKAIRAQALKHPTNIKKATLSQLRSKNARNRTALLRLTQGAVACGVSVVTTPGKNTVTVIPGQNGTTVIPATPPGTQGPDGTTRVTVTLPLGSLLNGLNLDLGNVLNGTPLPDVLKLVPLDQLQGLLPGVLQAGVDVPALKSLLTSTINTALSSVPVLGPLVAPVVTPLLNQVLSLLDGGDLSSLFQLTKVGDNVIQLVPTGLLGQLIGTVESVLGVSLGNITGDLPLDILLPTQS